jgi:hypothetical protein
MNKFFIRRPAERLPAVAAVAAAVLGSCWPLAQAHAQTMLMNDALSLSGFASLVVGKAISGSRSEPYSGTPCPCFIADYGHGAVYGNSVSVKQESKLGLQATYTVTPNLSATAQVVARGVDGVKVGLEWAYLSYDLTPAWTLQVGRKRLPIYYYSDFQDVGYAYTWVRPPADIYGWEIVNYNGFNATWRGEFGGWAVKSNLFAGGEDTKKNLYQRLYYDTPQDVTWNKIVGGDVVFTRDALTARLTYIQSGVRQRDHDSGERVTPAPDSSRSSERQRIYGFSVNADIGNAFVRSEYSVFDRSTYSYKSRAWMLGAGWRQGDFTAMLTHSRYGEVNAFTPDAVQRDQGWMATLRYELRNGMALKLQLDKVRDLSGPDYSFVGNSKVLSVSLDTVF